MPVLIISCRTSGRVIRKAGRTREECWALADRAVEGWLRKVQGSRYRDPRDKITGAAPGVRGKKTPYVFEVVGHV
jgi:hypothetical protein